MISTRLRSSFSGFVAHLSVIAVFRYTQTSHTEGSQLAFKQLIQLHNNENRHFDDEVFIISHTFLLFLVFVSLCVLVCVWIHYFFSYLSLWSMFSAADKLDFKRRRTERIRRERIDSSLTNDMENRRRSRANSQSDPIRRGRGRPKSVGLKKQEEEKGYLQFHITGPC